MFKYICFAMLLLFTMKVKAQFSKRHFHVETTITVEDSNSIMIFHIYQKHYRTKAKIDRTYHWFSGKYVFATQGGYDKNLLHGDYKALYKTKQLQSRGRFKKGLKKGEWRHWYANEIHSKRVYWKKGRQNGLEISYDSTGSVASIKRFKRGDEQEKIKTKLGFIFLKISPFKKRELADLLKENKIEKDPKVKQEKIKKIKEVKPAKEEKDKPKKAKPVKSKKEDKDAKG